MKYPTRISAALVLALSLPLCAQTPAPKPAQTPAQQTPYVVGSTVTGRVLCADTNAPARFARVMLTPTTPSHAGEDFMKNLESTIEKAGAKSGGPATLSPQQQQAMTRANSNMDRILAMVNATAVGLDGRFSFSGVKAGSYYVHAMYPGYVDPYSQFSDADFASTDPAMRARIARTTAQMPMVTVNGTDSAHVDLLLDRGAAVSGRLTYADGAPAIGWVVSAVAPGPAAGDIGPGDLVMAQAMAQSGAETAAKTDDHGNYRISGLPAGSYVVRAGLTATPVGINASNVGDGGTGIFLVVYSGNVFSAQMAKAITLTAGKDLPGIDITIPNGSLHNIVGHVYAKSDNHTLNIGKVALTSKSNPALRLIAAIRDDGSFHFQYLPSGVTYTVTVEQAADGKNTPGKANFLGVNIPNTTILHKYGTAATDVSLGDTDVENVGLTVVQTSWTPSAAGSCKPCTGVTPGDLVNGVLGVGDKGKP